MEKLIAPAITICCMMFGAAVGYGTNKQKIITLQDTLNNNCNKLEKMEKDITDIKMILVKLETTVASLSCVKSNEVDCVRYQNIHRRG